MSLSAPNSSKVAPNLEVVFLSLSASFTGIFSGIFDSQFSIFSCSIYSPIWHLFTQLRETIKQRRLYIHTYMGGSLEFHL